jgi:hypothetical protein
MAQEILDYSSKGAQVLMWLDTLRLDINLIPTMEKIINGLCVLTQWNLLAFLSTTTKNRITPTSSNGARNNMVIINLSLLQ